MRITSHSDISTQSIQIIIEVASREFDTADPKSLVRSALQDAASELAKTYVEDHKADILDNISPVAVANLAIADSAKLVRKQFIDPEEAK